MIAREQMPERVRLQIGGCRICEIVVCFACEWSGGCMHSAVMLVVLSAMDDYREEVYLGKKDLP